MRVLSRLDRIAKIVVLLILCSAAPTSVAQTLQQPPSLRPWNPTESRFVSTLELPALESANKSPAWLLDSQRAPGRTSPERPLPNVETEHASDLGTLENRSKPLSSFSTQSNRGSHRDTGRAFNLFRALGVQASNATNRR